MKKITDLMWVVLGLMLVVLNVIYSGWVLSLLWLWFIVPLGVASINVPWAIGLLLIVRLLPVRNFPRFDDEKNQVKDEFIKSLSRNKDISISITIILLSGYISNLFI
jgi:membrane protein implicated in regulation of membrane protease activity